MTELLGFGIFDWIEHRNAPLRQILEQRLEMAEAADQLGFYAYHIAEHQGTPLSLDSSPSVIVASAAQRTRRLRLVPMTYVLPWYNPLRLYNEICLLDQLSGGRLEIGLGRGASPIEGAYFGVTSVEQAREVAAEALEILLLGFGNPVLAYEGKHFCYRGVELYNKPMQQPYPPIWYPSSNFDSVPFIAQHGFNTSHNFAPNAVARRHFDRYREVYEQHKHDPGRMNAHVAAPMLTNTRHIYVAVSDEQAVAEARDAFALWGEHISYLSGRFSDRPRDALTLESRMANGTAIVGSPETARSMIQEMVDETGINYFLGVFNFGDLAQDRVLSSMELFAREVMPAFSPAEREVSSTVSSP
jgi:alkanesulfonate monooxygenase SsuD/methylene tetrahydromethanopterin reductase-like flavin-dependent oxidoreductase (luciferase family)